MKQFVLRIEEVEHSTADPTVWRVRACGLQDVDDRFQFIMNHQPPPVGALIVADLHV